MEDDDKLSVTDLDQKAEVKVPEVDLMTELEGKAEGDGLVLNL
jgi:hypothetical protein